MMSQFANYIQHDHPKTWLMYEYSKPWSWSNVRVIDIPRLVQFMSA